MELKSNFLICGTCAAGCSQITAALKQHPQIFLPINHRPEPHFFYKDSEYEKGVSYYIKKYFSEAVDEIAIGETSGSYMMGENTPQRIYEHFPHMKIIIQLRNPTLRAYANYRATVVHGLETLSFEEALSQEPSRIQAYKEEWKFVRPYSYIERSLYYKQVESFKKIFPAEQLLILKSEDTRKDPFLAFKRCYEFLGVSNNFVPKIPPSYSNRSVVDRSVQAGIREKIGSKIDKIIDYVEKEKDAMELSESPEEQKIIKSLVDNLEKTLIPMDEKCVHYLNNIFLKEKNDLQKILPFDIDDWYL
ncbi:MAG: sulfotransferase domain-containing protein [Alphaproteobacteria bacterium]